MERAADGENNDNKTRSTYHNTKRYGTKQFSKTKYKKPIKAQDRSPSLPKGYNAEYATRQATVPLLGHAYAVPR